jgi:hypothetical protein
MTHLHDGFIDIDFRFWTEPTEDEILAYNIAEGLAGDN